MARATTAGSLAAKRAEKTGALMADELADHLLHVLDTPLTSIREPA